MSQLRSYISIVWCYIGHYTTNSDNSKDKVGIRITQGRGSPVGKASSRSGLQGRWTGRSSKGHWKVLGFVTPQGSMTQNQNTLRSQFQKRLWTALWPGCWNPYSPECWALWGVFSSFCGPSSWAFCWSWHNCEEFLFQSANCLRSRIPGTQPVAGKSSSRPESSYWTPIL